MNHFDLCVGIDYSGAGTATTRSATIQVYSAASGSCCEIVKSPAATQQRPRNWCRREVAAWLIQSIQAGQKVIAGIDHGFSFPISYFSRYQLGSWHEFLNDFCAHWPTAEDGLTVDCIRKSADSPSVRTGSNTELRLTEKWTPSAKSVFLFDVQGSVAKSTHAGLPWLQHIRDQTGTAVHFWPFDGWIVPEGKSVLAEIYPSIFRRRYEFQERTADQQDAYAVARWLSEANDSGWLGDYLKPKLSPEDKAIANLEGWILGVA